MTTQFPPHENMVWIPGGEFLMGSDDHYTEEAPTHKVRVNGFWMDRTTVTNREFGQFISETGYVTLAERAVDPADYPGADPELLAPSSVVFSKPSHPVSHQNHFEWGRYVKGANWRHPQGPESSLDGIEDHPVVHVAWEDVEAYAKWAGKEIPREAEWEFAARGGLEGAEFVWGDKLVPDGKYMANTWQGEFPWENTLEDGFEGTAPVGSYPANGYGLFDMAGNVWQWTSDWYQEHNKIDSPCCTIENPRGGNPESSVDPNQAQLQIPRKVTKGGSHLCAINYCRRYRPAARMAQPIDTSISHLGIRCIVRSKSE
ncbi:MAG: formylglycine-generating enzyme family protein [Rhizobiaceae bacterium]